LSTDDDSLTSVIDKDKYNSIVNETDLDNTSEEIVLDEELQFEEDNEFDNMLLDEPQIETRDLDAPEEEFDVSEERSQLDIEYTDDLDLLNSDEPIKPETDENNEVHLELHELQ